MPLIFLEQKIWSEWGISIDIKFGFHNRLYESRLYVRLTSLAIWKRSFLKEAYMSLETRFGFCIKMCMKNAFCPRIIDFQLGETWTSPEENSFVHLVALKRWYYNLLRVPFSKLANIALILPNTAISLINWQLPEKNELANRRGIVFHHDYKRKTITVWLEYSTAFSVLPRSCSILLLFIIKNSFHDKWFESEIKTFREIFYK